MDGGGDCTAPAPAAQAHRASLADCLLAGEAAIRLARAAGFTALARLRAAGAALREPGAELAPLVSQGQVYVCGGYGAPASGSAPLRCRFLVDAARYEPLEGRWQALPPLRQARSGVVGAALAGSLYVCGGCTPASESLCSVERFDPVLGSWSLAEPMGSCRCDASGARLRGGLVVCGGAESLEVPPERLLAPKVLASAERYDAGSCCWEALPQMQEPRTKACAAALAGRLFVCGGFDGAQSLRSVVALDESGPWQPQPPMLQRRRSAAAAAIGGRLLVCGGYASGGFLRSVECLDSASGCWQEITSMSSPRVGAVAAVVGGAVCVFGGYGGRAPLASAERLDLATGAWSELPPEGLARGCAGAAFIVS